MDMKKQAEAKEIDFSAIEQKWQKKWETKKIFEVKEGKAKKYYVLEMYPYPSSSGLHMGHARNYIIGDIFARFRRMQGFNVLYPMGYDSFGLPAENAAIKAKSHPKKFTEDAIKNYIRQQKQLGLSYDWNRLLWSHNPEYYKWNQYWFLKMFEKGLAYRKKAGVNWCPKCESVLANEQVQQGKCWRHEDTDVEVRQMEQWFIKTTEYADELYEKIDGLQWPERIKLMQKNWIGKSFGIEINFTINNKKWPVFTTRPDTIFGVTFMVISAQHTKLFEIVSEAQKKDVEKFLKKLKSVSEKELEEMEKQGVFTGSYAINPLTNEKVPVYAGNFVVADYGSGMVMAVPCHDQRDFEFAKKYNLDIKEVIKGGNIKKQAFIEEGVLINSKEFNGINSKDAIEKISDYIEKNKLGKRTINYKLKDWLISRQRYWGTPIPMIYCDKCKIVPVDEDELPVKLPEKVKFGSGNPLATSKEFVNVKCPKCGGKARRETDTMDTFFDSSWYYLRYTDNKNSKQAFDKEKVKYWLPVDQYIGGAEHACLHLIYARFFTKFLRDLKLLNFDEPFTKLFNQGMLLGPCGEKMSKSKGNVINPEDIAKKYGIDTARFYLMFVSSPDKDMDWSDEGIQGSLRKIRKVFSLSEKKFSETDERTESKINKLIKEISFDIETFNYNIALIKISEFIDYLAEKDKIPKKAYETFLKILSPFCPHICEELWEKLGNKGFISLESWPEADEKKINEKFEIEEKMVEKLISDIRNILRVLESKGEKAKTRIKLFVIPKEIEIYKSAESQLEKVFNMSVEVLDIREAGKIGKPVKAQPGKPGIFLE